MKQMNVSITPHLVGYVRKKVSTGRYNNASEVVRDALRRMEEEDARALRLGNPTSEDIISDLTAEQLEAIRRRVRAGIASIDKGEFSEYQSIESIANRVKEQGRKRVMSTRSTR